MKWTIFSGPRGEKAGDLPEEIQNLIRGIEKFAPREHREERRVHYYNYGMLKEYQKPLQELLSAISEGRALAQTENKAQLLKSLFHGMKGFYDRKGRLSLEQAVEDRELRRKLSRVLLIFYKKEKTADSEIRSCLQGLREGKPEGSKETSPEKSRFGGEVTS